MRIRKIIQLSGFVCTISNSYSTSNTDTYSCEYINGKTVSTGWTDISATGYTTEYTKVGNVVCIRCFNQENVTVSGWGQTKVGEIPASIRPTKNVRGSVYCKGNSNIYCQVYYNSNDVIIFNWGNAASLTDYGQLAFTFTYVI